MIGVLVGDNKGVGRKRWMGIGGNDVKVLLQECMKATTRIDMSKSYCCGYQIKEYNNT